MADELYEPLLNRIDEKLQRSFSMDSSGSSIFKVPNQLRQTNEKAYEPHIISIGPYHRGKDHLKPMEEHKIHYLKRLLQGRNENSVARYVLALKAMEEKTRKCYAEPLDHIDEEAFIEMMLLDGCFIVQLIRRETGEYSRQENECVCGNSNMMISLTRDLLLVENQLPLFILLELFQMTQMHDQDSDFVHLAIDFFSEMMPGPRIQHRLISSDRNIKNLLGLVHDCWLPSLDAIDRYVSTSAEYGEWNFIRTATELVEAGIDFKNVSKNVGRSMLDIKFEKGVLWIPTIRMEDNTDSILRNLIAYEQCHNDIYPRYVTDYVTFMDCLINSKKDVELLCRSGVIENWLGDDRAVATVFNKLGESVVLLDDNFYSEIFIKVRNHCNRKWNIWMANLRHNYFNTPWALISFIAAVFLLILTVIQTLYTVLQYYQQ